MKRNQRKPTDYIPTMKPVIFREASRIWKDLSKDITPGNYSLELEIHKKLLTFFQVGDYYYYVFNVKDSSFDLMSKEVTQVLGYDAEEIDVPFMLSRIHPEDQPWFLTFEGKVSEFFSTLTLQQIPNYKVRYDYRIRKKNGDYIRILQQVVTIQFDHNGGVLRTFGVHTDITHLKKEGVPAFSLIGLNGEPSYINLALKKAYYPDDMALSHREREVLNLMIEGKTSKEIADQLYISQLTVQTHRKALLRKTGCANTASLISYAIRNGLV